MEKLLEETKEKYCQVTFSVLCKTAYGENVFLTGNQLGLKNWDANDPVFLSADHYSVDHPIWHTIADISLPVGKVIEYKFFKKEVDGKSIWENFFHGKNRAITFSCPGKYELTHIFGEEKREEIVKSVLPLPRDKIVFHFLLWVAKERKL